MYADLSDVTALGPIDSPATWLIHTSRTRSRVTNSVICRKLLFHIQSHRPVDSLATWFPHTSRTPHASSRTPCDSFICHELLLTSWHTLSWARLRYVSLIRHRPWLARMNSSWHITFPHTFSWARLRHVSFQRHGLSMAHSYVTNSPWPIHMSQILLTYLYVTHSVEIGSSTTWLTHTSRTPHDSSICHGLLLTYLLTSSYVANFLWLLRIQSHEPTCDSSCLVTNFLWLFHMLRTLLDFFTYNLMSPPATCLIQTSRTPRDSPICHELLLSYLLTFSLQISWARIRHVSFRRHGVLVIRPYITNSPWPIHMSRALVNSLTRQKLCLNRLVYEMTVICTPRTPRDSCIRHKLLATYAYARKSRMARHHALLVTW